MKSALRFVIPCLFMLRATAAACPYCSTMVAADSPGLARGFFWSILFVLGVLFGIVALLVRRIVREGTKEVSRREVI